MHTHVTKNIRKIGSRRWHYTKFLNKKDLPVAFAFVDGNWT